MKLAAGGVGGSVVQLAAARGSRTAILTPALDLIHRHGIGPTTRAAIAAELNVTRAAVYHHFNSGDDLVAAALAPLTGKIDALLDCVAVGSLPPGGRRSIV